MDPQSPHMGDARKQWEDRYASRTHLPPTSPSAFLCSRMGTLARGRALDIACGAGRNTLLLARSGFEVDGIDVALTGLRGLQAVARKEHLPVRLIQADLETFPLPRNRYDLVINIRYLQRSLWPPMKEALRERGVCLVETFLSDQRAFGQPSNPAFLLERGELRNAFRDFEEIAYEEGLLESENGPAYLARLLARRPATAKAR